MAHEDIYEEPVYRIFRGPKCGSAHFYMQIMRILGIFMPLVVVFLSEGLWRKTDTFREVPRIRFNGDFVVFGYTSDTSIISSSYAILNSAAGEKFSTSKVSHFFEEDGESQILNLSFEFSMKNSSFSSLAYAFLVDFELDYHDEVKAELCICDSLQLSTTTRQISQTARLQIDQSRPIEPTSSIPQKLINSSRQDPQYYHIASLQNRITVSPMSLEMARKSTIFVNGANENFRISLKLLIGEMEFTYRSGFWHLAKWAWIQYFAIWLIFDWIFQKIHRFLFENNVFFTTNCIRK